MTRGGVDHAAGQFEPGFFTPPPLIAVAAYWNPFGRTAPCPGNKKTRQIGGLHNPPTATSRTAGVISHGAV